MYKAVFIDLDGTLLRKDHSISLETRDLLRKLVAEDIMIVLVSARPFHGISKISEWLGLTALPVASLNGAYIRLDNDVIFESSIDTDTVAGLQANSSGFEATLIYYTGLEWAAEVSNAATAKEQRITEVKATIAPLHALIQSWQAKQAGPNKVMAIGPAKEIAALESRLISIYGSELNIYTSKPTYLEIMRQDASKTNAVKFLCSRYNIDRQEIIAIGDNFNDKEMIDYAGTGIAMGNAPDPVKAVADYVTDTNENDGVRKALQKFIQL